MMMWHFGGRVNSISEKGPMSRNLGECCSGILCYQYFKETHECVSKYDGVCQEGYYFHMRG